MERYIKVNGFSSKYLNSVVFNPVEQKFGLYDQLTVCIANVYSCIGQTNA